MFRGLWFAALLFLPIFTFAEVDENQVHINADDVIQMSADIFGKYVPTATADQLAMMDNLADALVQLARAPGSHYWTKAFILNLGVVQYMTRSIGTQASIGFLTDYMNYAATVLPYKTRNYVFHYATAPLKDLSEELEEFEKNIRLVQRLNLPKIPELSLENPRVIQVAKGIGLIIGSGALYFVSELGDPIFQLFSKPTGLLHMGLSLSSVTMVLYGVTRILNQFGMGSGNQGNSMTHIQQTFPILMKRACAQILQADPAKKAQQ